MMSWSEAVIYALVHIVIATVLAGILIFLQRHTPIYISVPLFLIITATMITLSVKQQS